MHCCDFHSGVAYSEISTWQPQDQPPLRMAGHVSKGVEDLSNKFDELSKLQGEALSRPLADQHDKIKQIFAEITRLDVALNNLLVRARTSLDQSHSTCCPPKYGKISLVRFYGYLSVTMEVVLYN